MTELSFHVYIYNIGRSCSLIKEKLTNQISNTEN